MGAKCTGCSKNRHERGTRGIIDAYGWQKHDEDERYTNGGEEMKSTVLCLAMLDASIITVVECLGSKPSRKRQKHSVDFSKSSSNSDESEHWFLVTVFRGMTFVFVETFQMLRELYASNFHHCSDPENLFRIVIDYLW